MNWLYYLAEANIYLCVFYLAYCLFFTNETYYQLNRAYLLFSCVVSFALPIVQIGVLKPNEKVVQNITAVKITTDYFTIQTAILYGYLLGVAICIGVLAIKLYQLYKLVKVQPGLINDRYKLIYIRDSNAAFSFFNYLFVGTNTAQLALITKHELVHIRQKHSIDIIILEIFKIINWFNPVVHLLQNSLKAIHEYIADEKTATNETDTTTYASFLVNNAYGLSGSSITHSFFNHNLLKRRIIMLHQKRSSTLARLKYLMAVPLCAGLLCESTLGFSKTYGVIDIAPHRGNVSNAALNRQDTTKKKQVNIRAVKVKNAKLLPPPPPKPPIIAKDKRIPPPPPQPPVVTKDHRIPPPPPPQPPAHTKVLKYPPPVVKPDKNK